MGGSELTQQHTDLSPQVESGATADVVLSAHMTSQLLLSQDPFELRDVLPPPTLSLASRLHLSTSQGALCTQPIVALMESWVAGWYLSGLTPSSTLAVTGAEASTSWPMVAMRPNSAACAAACEAVAVLRRLTLSDSWATVRWGAGGGGSVGVARGVQEGAGGGWWGGMKPSSGRVATHQRCRRRPSPVFPPPLASAQPSHQHTAPLNATTHHPTLQAVTERTLVGVDNLAWLTALLTGGGGAGGSGGEGSESSLENVWARLVTIVVALAVLGGDIACVREGGRVTLSSGSRSPDDDPDSVVGSGSQGARA